MKLNLEKDQKQDATEESDVCDNSCLDTTCKKLAKFKKMAFDQLKETKIPFVDAIVPKPSNLWTLNSDETELFSQYKEKIVIWNDDKPPNERRRKYNFLSVKSEDDDMATDLKNTSYIASQFLNCRKCQKSSKLSSEVLMAMEREDTKQIARLLNIHLRHNTWCECIVIPLRKLTNSALSTIIKFGTNTDGDGFTMLHQAAKEGNALRLEELLQKAEVKTSNEALLNSRYRGTIEGLFQVSWEECYNDLRYGFKKPIVQLEWTPLHVASAFAKADCVRILLKAGVDPRACDAAGRTPLDVAGSAFYYDEQFHPSGFAEVIRLLIQNGGTHCKLGSRELNDLSTPLHTALELDDLEAVDELMRAGAWVGVLNAVGETALHVCVRRKHESALKILITGVYMVPNAVDVEDIQGYTALHAAVKNNWISGFDIILDAGANVTKKDKHRENALHYAAELDHFEILTSILNILNKNGEMLNNIDLQNLKGETPLVKAVLHNSYECLNVLIQSGARTEVILPSNVNMFHIAAKLGNASILVKLLENKTVINEPLINAVAHDTIYNGNAPIHIAVENNNIDCVRVLINNNANLCVKTRNTYDTPLHLAAAKNNSGIAKIILDTEDGKKCINEMNWKGFLPLHVAASNISRNVASLLIKEGADLSSVTNTGRTALEILVTHIKKPTDFLEDVLDSCITTNEKDVHDPDCVISLDFTIFNPSVRQNRHMNVLMAIIISGNRYDQLRLLGHPLTEIYIHQKWKAFLPVFYFMISIYAIFVVSLSTFAVSLYSYEDMSLPYPYWLTHVLTVILFGSIALTILLELLCLDLRSSTYYRRIETYAKFGSTFLALIVPAALIYKGEWLRNAASCALMLSWMELMIMVSRLPYWGYYIQMFRSVSLKVIKILLIFGFIIIAFSLTFMIQFHSKMPFENPWSAFVKTLVMLASEFEYQDLFVDDRKDDLGASKYAARFTFVMFLVFAAVVLMNLLVGVAVNDVNNLKVRGKITRLEKKVDFLSNFLPRVSIYTEKLMRTYFGRKSDLLILTDLHKLPINLREAVLNLCLEMENKKKASKDEEFKLKMSRLFDYMFTQRNNEANCSKNYVKEVNNSLSSAFNEEKEIDGILENTLNEIDIDAIKQYLKRLENKIDQLKL